MNYKEEQAEKDTRKVMNTIIIVLLLLYGIYHLSTTSDEKYMQDEQDYDLTIHP